MAFLTDGKADLQEQCSVLADELKERGFPEAAEAMLRGCGLLPTVIRTDRPMPSTLVPGKNNEIHGSLDLDRLWMDRGVGLDTYFFRAEFSFKSSELPMPQGQVWGQ